LRPGDRVDLVEGEIFDMSPIGSRHAGIVDHLTRLLQRAVGDLALVRTQGPIRLDNYSEPEPDIVLLRPQTDFYKSAHPGSEDVLLVVEVADSSITYDRDIKLPMYARHGIPEVWLLDIVAARFTIYRSPRDTGFAEVNDATSLVVLAPEKLPRAEIEIEGLF
jgi:Uma2 family endonuclease